MNVIYLTSPGDRLPTVVHDPGKWVGELPKSNISLSFYNLSKIFWHNVFSSNIWDILSNSSNIIERFVLNSKKKKLQENSCQINDILNNLLKKETYEKAETYINTIAKLVDFTNLLNSNQKQCNFNLSTGISIKKINFNNSKSLVKYAKKNTFLSNIIKESINCILLPVNVLLLEVFSEMSLLSAIIITNIMRKLHPDIYICLANHSYENFSLKPFFENLSKTKKLIKIFDSIIENTDEKDDVIKLLIQDIAAGKRKKGLIGISNFKSKNSFDKKNHYKISLMQAFASEPILQVHLNKYGCYWKKCTFCVQKSKYSSHSDEIINYELIFLRIKGLSAAGYKNMIFIDEALSPVFLENISKLFIKNNLKIKWACRARLETPFSYELFKLMKQAGCYEVLFGLESISQKVLSLMNKYNGNIDKESTKKIIMDINKAGISVHINLIIGFPGEMIQDVIDSVNWTIDVMKNLSNSTYMLNCFILFHDSFVFNNFAKYGIIPFPEKGDIINRYRFNYREGPYFHKSILYQLYRASYKELYNKLGWSKYGISNEVDTAIQLYQNSGHGAIIKNLDRNPFDSLKELK
jgi:hypothetical protein